MGKSSGTSTLICVYSRVVRYGEKEKTYQHWWSLLRSRCMISHRLEDFLVPELQATEEEKSKLDSGLTNGDEPMDQDLSVLPTKCISNVESLEIRSVKSETKTRVGQCAAVCCVGRSEYELCCLRDTKPHKSFRKLRNLLCACVKSSVFNHSCINVYLIVPPLTEHG